MSDPGTILLLVLAVPGGLGVLLAVLSGLEDSLPQPPAGRQATAPASSPAPAADAAHP